MEKMMENETFIETKEAFMKTIEKVFTEHKILSSEEDSGGSVLLLRIENSDLLKVSIKNKYTTVFAKNKKVQFKHGSEGFTRQLFEQKIRKIMKEGDYLLCKGDMILETSLNEIFVGMWDLRFKQMTKAGVIFFKCTNPEAIGLSKMYFSGDLCDVDISFPQNINRIEGKIGSIQSDWGKKIEDFTSNTNSVFSILEDVSQKLTNLQ